MFERSRVQIPKLDIEWSIFDIMCCKIELTLEETESE